MDALEAMTFLINEADYRMKTFREAWEAMNPGKPCEPEQVEWLERTEIATAVIQAMLNTALPIARFRCHVTIEAVLDKKAALGLCEFVISSVNIDGIKAGLSGLAHQGLTVAAHLFEQKPESASMVSGYQGNSKTLQYRNWLKQIDQFELAPTLQ